MIKHVHGDRVDHGCFLLVVFKHKHHVEILEMELHTLKMNQLHVFQRYHEGRLQERSYS